MTLRHRLTAVAFPMAGRDEVDQPASPVLSTDMNPTSPFSPISPWPPLLPEVPDSSHTATSQHLPAVYVPLPVLPSAKEVYGSLGVLLTALGYGVYLLWAFLPPHYLDAVGWSWYPARCVAIVLAL